MRALPPLAVPLLCGSCGVLLTHGPPADHANLGGFHCTSSVAGPLLDAAVAIVGLGITLRSTTNKETYVSPESNASLLLGVVRASIWGISATIGFDKVSKCAAAKRQLAARHVNAPSGTTATTRV